MEQQRGFTLIELMIVVAIVGILASLALPAYSDYSKRAKMSEVILAASACRSTITEVYQSTTTGSLPSANSWGCEVSAALSNQTKYVSSVATTAQGKVTIMAQGFGDVLIDSMVVSFVPMTSTGAVATAVGDVVAGWRCGNTGDGTTIPKKYLPSSCNGNY